MGVVEVGEWTVSSRTEVKCYQFIWSFRERCWFESTMRESHRVPKKRSEHKHLLTVTKTGHGSLGRPRKPRSAPERIVFQTPDDRVELLFRSSGVWGTESFTAASTDWSDVSLNRDKLEWVCLRSKLWMQPVTEWVFSTHTRTQTHTLTHPFSSHSRTFRHMYKHTTSHLWHKNQHETRPVWRGLLSVTQQPLLWWVRLIDGGSTCWPLVRRQDPCSVSTTLKSSGHISWSQIKKVKSDPWVNLCPTCDQETEQISAGSVTIFLRSYASSDKWTRECETATETNLNLTTTVVKTMSFNQHKRRILDRKPSIVSSRQLKLHVCKGSWEQETSHPETHTDRLRIRSAKIHQRPRLHSGNDIIIRTSQLNNVLFLFFTFNLLPYFSLTGAASPPQEFSTETRNCLLL